MTAKEIAEDFDIEWSEIQGALEEVSMLFNMSWVNGPPKDCREAEINKCRLLKDPKKPVENSD
jgi:DNA-directed RNA polymerase specialized sigma subunit